MNLQLPPLSEREILADVEQMLDASYNADRTLTSTLTDRTKALCLADVVFSSLFYLGNQHYPEVDAYDLDFLVSREPSLTAFEWTGWYEIRQGDPMNQAVLSQLRGEESAVINLADSIQNDIEMALCCWNLAKQIANSPTCHWSQGDFAFDCMVVVGLRPMYEWFEHPQGSFACIRGAL